MGYPWLPFLMRYAGRRGGDGSPPRLPPRTHALRTNLAMKQGSSSSPTRRSGLLATVAYALVRERSVRGV
jgi:hypothetical protein